MYINALRDKITHLENKLKEAEERERKLKDFVKYIAKKPSIHLQTEAQDVLKIYKKED